MAVERQVVLRLATAELYGLTTAADVARLRAPAPRAPACSEAGLASTHPPLRQTEVPS
jgi:hypothetical protein